MSPRSRITCFVVAFCCLISCTHAFYLIFPQTSVLQLTMSVSAPVFAPNHKIYFDWGFQANYDLPSNYSYFYSPIYWPGIFNKREANEIDHSKYQQHEGVHPSDFSAGELYTGLEDLLVSYDFHETCLLKSVCELAKHPFHDDEENIITEILTFVLSPSMHEAFAKNETVYKETYEEAEKRGFLGGDCDKLYPFCEQDFLSVFSKIMTSQELSD